MSEIAKLLAVPLAEIAVIGDGSNDVAMFERSGLSIAMGNASPAVQQAADFVTDSNRDEGFANAIERFILGGGRSNASGDGTQQVAAHDRARTRRPKISLVLADVDGTLVTTEKVLTPARGRSREGAARRGHRLCDHQRPAAARHGDVDRAVGAEDADRRLQRRRLRSSPISR